MAKTYRVTDTELLTSFTGDANAVADYVKSIAPECGNPEIWEEQADLMPYASDDNRRAYFEEWEVDLYLKVEEVQE